MDAIRVAAATQSPSAQPGTDGAAWVHKHLAGWPPATQKLAADLVSKYGAPAESGERRLTWYGNGPWKRTELYREETPHNFPAPHKDVLEQTVNYRVPADKMGPLAAYNGSLIADRTRGELSARGDSEEANIVTLNIANDIVTGERDVEQALTYHAQVARGRMIREPEPYAAQLRFKPPGTNAETADPAEIAPLIRHMTETE